MQMVRLASGLIQKDYRWRIQYEKFEMAVSQHPYLDQLEKREGEAWNQVAAHILERQANEYNRAVTLLTDLHDLAVRQGQVGAFRSALENLRRTHAAKESFLRRLARAKL